MKSKSVEDSNEIPEDVKKIIAYAKLKKKYPDFDKNLRIQSGFEGEINMEQMNMLLSTLEEKEKNDN